jgi:hypothetical protein
MNHTTEQFSSTSNNRSRFNTVANMVRIDRLPSFEKITKMYKELAVNAESMTDQYKESVKSTERMTNHWLNKSPKPSSSKEQREKQVNRLKNKK